jgi:hypothetical protein
MLLIDDGGRAIRMLHSDRFADIRDRFTCVEQTRCGIRTIEDLRLRIPVINVAESWVKLEHESPMIAESVNRELARKLAAMRSAGIRIGRRALIIGYGAIGRAVGSELRDDGWEVDVYDADARRLTDAAGDGFGPHEDLRRALRLGGVIIGCTGKPVLDRPDYALIPEGAILISASSADVEFRSWQLRPVGDCLGRPETWTAGGTDAEGEDPTAVARDRDRDQKHPCFSLYRVQYGPRRFYLVNGGFPVNFTGGVDPIAPSKIQLTRSLLHLAAVQASRTWAPGLHELDDASQRLLIDAFRADSRPRAA